VRRTAAGLIAAAVSPAVAANASAQIRRGRDTPRAGSWEIAGGFIWTGGIDGPDRAAELTRNGETAGGFDLFKSSSRISGAPGGGAALGFYLSRALALEAGVRYSRPRLTIGLSGDFENADPVSADEILTRYVFTGSVVLHLRQMSIGRRAVPYVSVGAGHIRDLHQGNELIETGTEYHAVGGLKYWFGAARRRFGVRGDAGVSISDGGFDFKDERRVLPIASASLVCLF
jgi:hypothetical protein